MRTSTLLAVLLAAGCSDYKLQGNTGTGSPLDTDTDTTGQPVDTAAPADELCNGVDDDGDGEIDEGFPDSDGDGIKDCLDDDCDVELASAGTVTVDSSCYIPDVTVPDPWNVQVEWYWDGLAANKAVHNVIMTPVVGNLTDDNGDGLIDVNDVPEIVFVAFDSSNFTSGKLVALSGDTGKEVWSVAGFNGGGGIALADVDSDGFTDVIAFDSSNRPVVVDHTGKIAYTSTTAAASYYPQATVADLDEDGHPEIIADNLILSGKLKLLHSFTINGSIPYRLPAVGDLNLDGTQEVILGDSVYSGRTGAFDWKSSIAGTYGHWAAIIDTDGDANAEVAMVGAGHLAVYQDDGTLISDVAAGTNQPGPPCAADFDGDGQVEIAWASSATMNVYELNGKKDWSMPIDDSSGLAGCSAYDVDGDGVYEVLYADQDTVWIFDGKTGKVNWSQTGHASGTLWEYPSVADVDNDGSAEIVVASNNYWMSGWGGIHVFGHKGSTGWLKSGTTWHTHDFATTNINSDGSVPISPTPWWQVYNVYRGRPGDDGAATDLQVAITDVCAAGCDDASPLLVAAQISNDGGDDIPAGVPVTLYRNDGGTLTALATQALPAAIPSGTSTDGIEFDITNGDMGSDGLELHVDDDGSGTGVQTECDESNNTAVWTDKPC